MSNAAVDGEKWRVIFGVRAGQGERVEKSARRTTGEVDVVHPSRVVCYCSDEPRARQVIVDQSASATTGFELSHWDEAAGVWATIERVGDITLQAGSDVGKVSVARPFIIIGVTLVPVAIFALFFLLTLLIPGASQTPNAGPHHDLGRSLGLAAAGTVVVSGFAVYTLRRR